jgi:hypothetical protein
LSDNTCVACLTDANCTTAAAPLCDSTAGTCVACNATGVSDPNTRCAADAPGTVCATSGSFPGQCRACDPTDDQGCTTAPNDQCNATTATCVDCDASGGCALGQQCRLTDNMCVECLTDAQCGAALPLCESNVCVACDGVTNNDARCAAKTTGTVCSASGTLDGQCTACDPSDDGGCTGQQCRPSDHTCVACIDNATTPCAGNLACIANACTACTGDVDCTGHVTGAQCVVSAGGQCHVCDPAEAQCSGTTPICSTTTFTCTACTADVQCSGGLFCVPGGSCTVNTAACDPINGNADCAADPLHPTCTDIGGAVFFCR